MDDDASLYSGATNQCNEDSKEREGVIGGAGDIQILSLTTSEYDANQCDWILPISLTAERPSNLRTCKEAWGKQQQCCSNDGAQPE